MGTGGLKNKLVQGETSNRTDMYTKTMNAYTINRDYFGRRGNFGRLYFSMTGAILDTGAFLDVEISATPETVYFGPVPYGIP